MKKLKIDKKEKTEKVHEYSDSDENSSTEENVDVEFEAFGLCEKDTDGISSLLKQIFLKEDVNVTEMAKILVDQVNVGCIFMSALDDDEENVDEEIDNEIYGVVSMLDLTENQDKSCVQQIKSVLQKYNQKNPDVNSRKIFNEIFTSSSNTKKVGLLINERTVNLPHHIALPALKSVTKDLDSAGKNFDKFLAILKMHKFSSSSSEASTSSKGKNKNSEPISKRKRTKKKVLAEPKDGENIFTNAEEEFLFEECKAYFDYDAVSDQSSSAISSSSSSTISNAILDLKPYRRIVLFDRHALNRFIEKLDQDIQSHCT